MPYLDTFKKRLSWETMELPALLSYYRYVSLLITSGLYLVGPPLSPVYLKVGVCIFLFLEAFVFTRLYNMEGQSDRIRKLLIFIETLGLASILILTGGLSSPFLWYAINPILLSATLLPAYFCWLMVSVFVVSAAFLQRFDLYGVQTTLAMWPERYPFILIFVLVTLAAQVFNYFIRRTTYQAAVMEEQLQHIKDLYEAVEVFSNRTDPREIVTLFASYSKAMTGALKVIIWVETESELRGAAKKSYYAVKGMRRILPEEQWYPYLKRHYQQKATGPEFLVDHMEPVGREGQKGALLTLKVKSASHVFGLLSAFYPEDGMKLQDARQTLGFMADLCATALEKHYLESVAEEVLLVEEKDRIAREIHDNVTQNLFGLIYGLGMIIKKNALPEELNERMRLMQQTAQKTLKELREAIYRMSSLTNDREPFLEGVQKYLRDLGQMNNVRVDFSHKGLLQQLPSQLQRSFFRIIREATGNAIRHGQCSSISVSLEEGEGKFILEIFDDGKGFEPPAEGSNPHSGLGLINMKELTRSMGGELRVESAPGRGTRIHCEINLGRGRMAAP